MKGRGPKNITLAERVFRRIARQPDGCWNWTAAIDPTGYGRFWLDGRMQYAHRVVYELFVEPIPEGLTLDHLCRNHACVNPAHLEPVTLGENVLRGVGISAVNARKTHCIRGHEFTDENTARNRNGTRRCVACSVERGRENYERHKARRQQRWAELGFEDVA